MSWFKEKCWLVDITKRINNKGGYPEADLLEVVHYPPASPPPPQCGQPRTLLEGSTRPLYGQCPKVPPPSPSTEIHYISNMPRTLPGYLSEEFRTPRKTNVAVCCTKFILLSVQLKESGENPSWNEAMHCIPEPRGDDWALTHHPHTTACQLRAFVEFGQSRGWQ